MSQYVARFREIAQEAMITEESMLKHCIMQPVPREYHIEVLRTIKITNNPNAQSLDFTIQALLDAYEILNDLDVKKKLPTSHKIVHSKKAQSSKPYSLSRPSKFRSEPSSSHQKPRTYCSYHNSHEHNTADCRSKKRRDERKLHFQQFKSKGKSRTCFTCKGPWKPGHVCKSMSKGKPSKTSNTKDPVPRPPQSDDEGDVFMDEGSSDNEDHNLQFAAADFDLKGKGKADCKYTVTTHRGVWDLRSHTIVFAKQ